MKKLLIFCFLVPFISHAEWLCKEAASQAEGNIFFSCGVASSTDLYIARRNSLLNAKREFKEFCEESDNCKGRKYIISPMRTDCSEVKGKYICYRGLEYKILNKKRDYSNIDVSDLEDEIENKEEKLQLLNRKLNGLNQIRELEDKISYLENIDHLDLEIDQLKSKLNDWPKGNAGFHFSYIKIPFTYGSDSLFGVGAEYERLIYKDIVGFKFNLNYLMGLSTKVDIQERGSPNSLSNPEYHSHKGIDVNISVPIHIKHVTISPKLGYTSIHYESTVKVYNEFGVGRSEQSTPKKYDESYIGLGLRYGDRFYIEIEGRRYLKLREQTLSPSIGISIPF